VVLIRFWLEIWGVLGYFRGLEGLKCKNKATFVPQTQKVFIVQVALFFHFDHSKPQIRQIVGQNRAKTTGKNDLEPDLPSNFF